MSEDEDLNIKPPKELTLRDYFAIHALPITLDTMGKHEEDESLDQYQNFTKMAYKWADAMLQVREK